jgi:hypothetical protein
VVFPLTGQAFSSIGHADHALRIFNATMHRKLEDNLQTAKTFVYVYTGACGTHMHPQTSSHYLLFPYVPVKRGGLPLFKTT